jgi:hypothetical protein
MTKYGSSNLARVRIPMMAQMSPPLRASNEGLLRDRALREHRRLTGPSHPLLAGFFSILPSAAV